MLKRKTGGFSCWQTHAEGLNGSLPASGASSNTLGGWYTVPGPKPDNSYALFNVGAAADFGGVTGYVSGSGTAARGDGNYWAVTVGLRMPL
jgi:hypothetical protein